MRCRCQTTSFFSLARSVLVCQSVSLIDLDGDDSLRTGHIHGSVDSVDDRHELQEKRTPEDAVLAGVEACDFEC
jgi:hypothetical protein